MSTSARCRSVAPHEVFISHRGLDMKLTFANELYHALKDRGINAFLDMEELSKGEDVRQPMMEAVRRAKFQVPIFTPIYGTSSWCLDELAEMMDRKQNLQSKVIPIYYDLKSEDLRTETGQFARELETFLQQQEHDAERVKRWKDALREASWIEGFRRETYGRRDGALIRAVVAEIWADVCDSLPQEVPEINAVGLDCKAEKLGQLMRMSDDTVVHVLLLWGMGGIGKTTLARAVLSRYRKGFEVTSFVESCGNKKAIHIQNDLRKDLLGDDQHLGNDIDRGRACLEFGLREKKALIVLDDLKDLKSVNTAIELKKLGPGSRILLTSRNKVALPHKEEFTSTFQGETSEVEKMDMQNSLKLFCLHAFRKSCADPAFDSVLQQVVQACDGVPLALEVVGGLLSTMKTQEQWKEAIFKLRRSDYLDISSKLMISYEALTEEEQQMFQDVACFLIEQPERRAKQYWKGLGYCCEIGLEKLKQLCLVKVNKFENFTMHDLLQDLGRKIGTSSKTRVYDDEKLKQLLTTDQDLSQIRALATSLPSLDASVLCKMQSLQLLFLYNTTLTGSENNLKRLKLQWLRWITSDHDSFPSRMSVKFLSVLELKVSPPLEGYSFSRKTCKLIDDIQNPGENIQELPRNMVNKHVDSIQHPRENMWQPNNIREFYFQSRFVHKPLLEWLGNLREGADSFQNLEVLTLQVQNSLTKLPFYFGQLKSLWQLTICSHDLVELPSSFGKLKKLRYLTLNWCKNLRELPQNLGCLESLEVLEVWGTPIIEFPSSLGELKKLRVVNITNCEHLRQLPQNFGCLESLEKLIAGKSSIVELPSSFGKLKKLRDVDISFCKHLSTLPQSFGCLENLEQLIARDSSIVELPSSFGKLKKLREVNFSNCQKLRELPQSFGCLESLETLVINNSSITQYLLFGELKKLRALDVDSFGYFCLQALERLETIYSSIVKLPPKIRNVNEMELEDLLLLRSPNDICMENLDHQIQNLDKLLQNSDQLMPSVDISHDIKVLLEINRCCLKSWDEQWQILCQDEQWKMWHDLVRRWQGLDELWQGLGEQWEDPLKRLQKLFEQLQRLFERLQRFLEGLQRVAKAIYGFLTFFERTN